MEQEFHSIKRLPPYVFAEVNALKTTARARVKSYIDYGAFTPIQAAATTALNAPQDCLEEMRARPLAPRRADPGPDLGGLGRADDHVRFSLVENEHRTRQAIRNIKGFLKSSEKTLEETEGRKLAS
jgi:alanine-synthesizing transaminase